jgi:hypothetical protein
MPNPVVAHMLQLRRTLIHQMRAATHPNTYNAARDQLIPLEQSMRDAGIELPDVPHFITLAASRGVTVKANFTQRVMSKVSKRK